MVIAMSAEIVIRRAKPSENDSVHALVQAIADEVELRLKAAELRPAHVEGYKQAEWVLLDYVDFVVHVFSEKARKFYDLERLWKSAKRLEPSDLKTIPRKKKLESKPTASKKKKRAKA